MSKQESFKCPKWLDREAKKEWQRVIKEYGESLTYLDMAVLSMYCQSFSVCSKMAKELKRKGEIK